jgi:hypothetical protein
MTDRDTFAAAALTGLLTKDDAAKPESMAPWWPEWVCAAAYRWADAMLCARSRTGQVAADTPPQSRAGTNHDAVPEAIATTTPLNKGAACNTATSGTGNTPALSESEREAIEQMLDEASGKACSESWVPEILRNLLERLK